MVQIRQPDRSWADSTIRRCPRAECKNTFGGTLADRLAYVRDAYGYKYFGDYELSPEQVDAVWGAKALAELVPDLLEALRDIAEPMQALARQAEANGSRLNGMAHQIANDPAFLKSIARVAVAKAEGQ